MPQRPYPGDQYIKDMVSQMGFVKKDANKNTIIGEGVSIDANSVGNFIVADNAVIKNSHNNFLHAKNVVIENASGASISGADHTIKFGSNYADVDGDANWCEGYASKTSGFGNINCCYAGRINGQNNRIGLKGQPNKYKDSTIDGSNCEIDGNNCHAIGSFIRIIGDNITVVGNPPAGTIYTTPGVHIVN